MLTESYPQRLAILARHALPALALGAVARARVAAPRRSGPQSILVTRLDHIGDFVLLTPFLRELRALFPDANIILVVGRSAAPLASRCPYVDEVHALDLAPKRPGFPSYRKYLEATAKHLRHLTRFARTSLRGRIDLAIQPRWDEDLNWATLVTALAGAPRSIGFTEKTTPRKSWSNFGHDWLFTDVLLPGMSVHEAQRNFDIIRYLGGSPEGDTPKLWWDETDERAADQFAASVGLASGGPVVAFGIGSSKGTTRWPHYPRLISLLAEEVPFTPLLVTGPGEEVLASEVLAACPSAVVMEKMRLPVVAAVLSRCSLYVGNNSGPLHLASAVGLTVVELSSHAADGDPGHQDSPARFGSLAPQTILIRPASFLGECRGGCLEDSAHCITGISVEQVAQEVLGLLKL